VLLEANAAMNHPRGCNDLHAHLQSTALFLPLMMDYLESVALTERINCCWCI